MFSGKMQFSTKGLTFYWWNVESSHLPGRCGGRAAGSTASSLPRGEAVKVPEEGEVEESERTGPGHFPDRSPHHQHIKRDYGHLCCQ